MAGTLEHFIAFGVDNAGLERFLRLIQSLFWVLTCYPSLLLFSPIPLSYTTPKALYQLLPRINITRRWMRLFRFLDTFRTSYALYTSTSASGVEKLLDVVSRSCMAIFGMLESVTLLDLLAIEEATVFGYEGAVKLNKDAQVFWFTGLATSVLSCLIKMLKLHAYRPVAQPDLVNNLGQEKEKKSTEQEKQALRKTQEESARKFAEQRSALGWKIVSDSLDLVIPSSALGWIQVEAGVVASAMLVTSVLTGYEVWKRCGREVDERKA